MFGYAAKAPELVCVAIGVNLLFPVAPVILGKLLPSLETDVNKLFKDAQKGQFLVERDVADLKAVFDEILKERERCSSSKFGWPVWDGIAVVLGVVLLWSGLVDFFGGWCVLLFLPGIAAVVHAWRRFYLLKKKHSKVVKSVGARVRVRMEDAKSQPRRSQDSDSFVSLQKAVFDFLDSRKQSGK